MNGRLVRFNGDHLGEGGLLIKHGTVRPIRDYDKHCFCVKDDSFPWSAVSVAFAPGQRVMTPCNDEGFVVSVDNDFVVKVEFPYGVRTFPYNELTLVSDSAYKIGTNVVIKDETITDYRKGTICKIYCIDDFNVPYYVVKLVNRFGFGIFHQSSLVFEEVALEPNHLSTAIGFLGQAYEAFVAAVQVALLRNTKDHIKDMIDCLAEGRIFPIDGNVVEELATFAIRTKDLRSVAEKLDLRSAVKKK